VKYSELVNETLARAAAEVGIEPEYTDIWGRRHETPENVSRAILAALGFSAAAGDDAQLEHAVEERAASEWSRPLDPVLVLREDADSIALRIPADRSGASVKLEIQWENGDLEHHWFWVPELRVLEKRSVDGREFIAKRLPLPNPLRLGYHRIQVYWMKEPELEVFGRARFIVCPRKAYQPPKRMAGVGMSLYGLRSGRNWGCGDFTDLAASIDRFAAAGASFIALNPLHAIANRQPYNTSPYLPECGFYRNFIYLDVERVGSTPLNDGERGEVDYLRTTEFVEYERVAALKLAVLRRIFAGFQRAGGSDEFNHYVESEGSLLDRFAAFCALDEELHRADPNVWLWTQWPAEYQQPESAAVQQFAESHRESVLFYKFLQWHISRQLAEAQALAIQKGMALGLYHDLALATDQYGADVWAYRPFYVLGCRVGSPPDDFSPAGQDWSFPPPCGIEHRNNGYELFAQSIRKAAQYGGALRIDHVMRFVHLYWIPKDMPATEGAYVRDCAADLLGILALESVRAKFVVIGEDLGTVTDEIRRTLADAGLLSYRLLWFERRPDGSFRRPDEYPKQALVSITTHDLATLAGFKSARDVDARRAAALIDGAEYARQKAAREVDVRHLNEALQAAGFVDDPLGFALSTPCQLALVSLEDLSGETEQQNLPGSTAQYPNWRRKMNVTVEDFGPLAQQFSSAVERSSRR